MDPKGFALPMPSSLVTLRSNNPKAGESELAGIMGMGSVTS